FRRPKAPAVRQVLEFGSPPHEPRPRSRPSLVCRFLRIPASPTPPLHDAHPIWAAIGRRTKSGRGLPHSKTLSRRPKPPAVRQVLVCGSPPREPRTRSRPSQVCRFLRIRAGPLPGLDWIKTFRPRLGGARKGAKG